jgi:hypothetical protein
MTLTLNITAEDIAHGLSSSDDNNDPTKSEAFQLIVAIDKAQESYEFTQALIEHLQRELDIEDEHLNSLKYPE